MKQTNLLLSPLQVLRHTPTPQSTSQAYVRHPELAAAKANRDFVFKQVCEAVNTISDVAQGKATGAGQMPYEGPGELASALDDFDVSITGVPDGRLISALYSSFVCMEDIYDFFLLILIHIFLLMKYCFLVFQCIEIKEHC